MYNFVVVITVFTPLQAAILQQTAEYIFALEQEKTRLLQQNSQLKRFIQVRHSHHLVSLVCTPHLVWIRSCSYQHVALYTHYCAQNHYLVF